VGVSVHPSQGSNEINRPENKLEAALYPVSENKMWKIREKTSEIAVICVSVFILEEDIYQVKLEDTCDTQYHEQFYTEVKSLAD